MGNRMMAKRLAAFLAIVILSGVVIVWTSPTLLNGVRLGLDLQGGFEILYEVEPLEEGQELTRNVLREAAKNLEERANASRVDEPDVTPLLPNRIRVRLAGVENQEQLMQRLKEPAVLTFRSSDGCASPTDYCKIELEGKDFVEDGASVQYEQGSTTPIVAIKLKNPDKFEEVTGRLASLAPEGRNVLAIFMDDQLISAPTVNFAIGGGEAIITGRFTHREAEDLAQKINLGALPVKLTEKYTQRVEATLGRLSLEQTLTAGLIGSAFIILFMLGVYRLPGLVACITLIIYTWLLLLIFYWMRATLTLPGVAAFVLGVGMAVDANIITAERIKDELRSGKTMLSSLKAGSRNAFRTIMDANITTIIAGAALYFLGTGAIQGFALTLIFSIIVSIVTNVWLARVLLNLLVTPKMAKNPRLFGVKESEIREL